MPDTLASAETLSERQRAFDRLCEIVARLRAPGGCPWDREQTHVSILPQLIEEAYEVVEAARRTLEDLGWPLHPLSYRT